MRLLNINLLASLLISLSMSEELIGGALQFTATTVSAQAVLGQPSMPAIYVFKNTSHNEVIITGITTSCDCTVAATDARVYKTGQAGTVKAVLKLDGLEGRVTRTIVITTDEPTQNVYSLILDADIPVLVSFMPKFLAWRSEEGSAPKSIAITRVPGTKMAFLKVVDTSGLFQIENKAHLDTLELIVTPRSTTSPIATELSIDLLLNDNIAVHRQAMLRILPTAIQMDPFRRNNPSAPNR